MRPLHSAYYRRRRRVLSLEPALLLMRGQYIQWYLNTLTRLEQPFQPIVVMILRDERTGLGSNWPRNILSEIMRVPRYPLQPGPVEVNAPSLGCATDSQPRAAASALLPTW